jgi:hypothetical protein
MFGGTCMLVLLASGYAGWAIFLAVPTIALVVWMFVKDK